METEGILAVRLRQRRQESNRWNTWHVRHDVSNDTRSLRHRRPIGWQNVIAERAGLTIEPRHRWTITGQYLDFRLASATDALYNISGGTIVRDTTGKAGTHIGKEADVYTWYELNRHVNVGVGLGHIFGDEFLAKTTNGVNYNFPYFALNFKDNAKSR
jgi:hypothetical protein